MLIEIVEELLQHANPFFTTVEHRKVRMEIVVCVELDDVPQFLRQRMLLYIIGQEALSEALIETKEPEASRRQHLKRNSGAAGKISAYLVECAVPHVDTDFVVEQLSHRVRSFGSHLVCLDGTEQLGKPVHLKRPIAINSFRIVVPSHLRWCRPSCGE